MLVFSAADFEDFLEPRPELARVMDAELESVVRHLATTGWPFRLHATYDESITRFLDVFERVHRDMPIDKLRWFLDHAETITTRNIERVKALGGGIAVQHRMAYQGEYFVARYGAECRGAARRQCVRCSRWECRWVSAPTRRAWPVTTRGSALSWLVSGTRSADCDLSAAQPARSADGAQAVYEWVGLDVPRRRRQGPTRARTVW